MHTREVFVGATHCGCPGLRSVDTWCAGYLNWHFREGGAFVGSGQTRWSAPTRGGVGGSPDEGQEAVFGLGGVVVVAGEVVAEGGVFAGGAEDVE